MSRKLSCMDGALAALNTAAMTRRRVERTHVARARHRQTRAQRGVDLHEYAARDGDRRDGRQARATAGSLASARHASAEHFRGKQLAIIKWCARLRLTHVIANSAASAQALAKLTSFDSARIDAVFNGIAADPFDALRTVPQAVLRERLNLPRDAFLVDSLSESSRRIDHLNGSRAIDRIRNRQTRFPKARYRYLLEVLQDLTWRVVSRVQDQDVDSRVHPLYGYI
ncbi:hypothetical protein HDG37_000264 [Paraburkholderia sp. MM5384-R2]|nr:hypothetical protein [Paraburkholderia sp. MM5384-R2]